MATVTGTSPLQGLRGTIGNQLVFRKYGDKTVVSAKPLPRKKNSRLQQLNTDKFREAAKYARTIMRDPVKRDKYRNLAKKQNKHSAWNVAISEYMLTINIEAKSENPAVSRRVTITATKKNSNISNVIVKLVSPANQMSADGTADRVSTTQWIYDLPVLRTKGDYLLITATDALGLDTTRHVWL